MITKPNYRLINKQVHHGFTLIELSIVFVVIGILIGGIMVAQSMSETAKITAFVKQIESYDTGVSNFKLKYNYLPGDIPSQITGGWVGDGNGYIQAGGASNNFQQEIMMFWYHLSTLESCVNPPVAHPNSYSNHTHVGITVPKINLGEKTTGAFGYRSDATGKNIYGIQGINEGSGSTLTTSNSIPTSQALAADAKTDDGVANTGTVRAMGTGPGYSPTSTVGSGCVVNGAVAKYNLSSTSSAPCSLSVDILPNQL